MSDTLVRRLSGTKTTRTPADGARVSDRNKREIAYWTERFGCTDKQLSAAVQKVGVMADHVEAHIRQCKH